MTTWDKDKGYLYVRSGYSLDGTHGGHEAEHKAEIEAIANEIVDAKLSQIIPQLQEETYLRAVNDLLSALKVDVNSIVTVALSNAGNIFYGKECQTVLMDAIFKEIQSNLNSIITIR